MSTDSEREQRRGEKYSGFKRSGKTRERERERKGHRQSSPNIFGEERVHEIYLECAEQRGAFHHFLCFYQPKNGDRNYKNRSKSIAVEESDIPI